MKKIKDHIFRHKYVISFFLLSLSFSFFLLLTMSIESDYFWHIKAGEYMFKNGLLKKDVFSWILNGKYWMSHEWLFEIIIYVFKLLFGNYHVLIYGGICLVSLFLILFFRNKKKYLNNIPFTLLWFVLSIILVVFIQVRPHLISFCFVAITIYFLYDLYENENSKKIYFLPIISVFWSNLHGGSSNLSYLFCLIFLVCGLFSFNFSKIEAISINRKQIIKYLIIMLLCMVGVCLNIHGFKMFIYPYSNMLDTLMINNITEWQSTSLNNPDHYIYFVLVLIIVFVMLLSKRKILFIDFILFGICVFLGLKSMRFWGYTYVIMSFVIFNYIEKREYDYGSILCINLISLICFLFFIFNYSSVLNNFNTRVVDQEIIYIIKEESPKKIFNMYNYGGELVYNDVLVFVDGRADLYSKYNLLDYLNISTLNGDYVKLISKYDFDYFLVDSNYPINTYLKYNSDYEMIIDVNDVILYKKKTRSLK